MKRLVGSIKVGEEFRLAGRTFKRIGSYLYGFDAPLREILYDVRWLPNAKDGKPLETHQNAIMVQEKEAGGFYFAECWEVCDD